MIQFMMVIKKIIEAVTQFKCFAFHENSIVIY